MNIAALISARAGSKGIPFKNIIPLGGHPLIAYSIAAAKLSRRIHEVLVSTDSENIRDIAVQYGADVPFLRPPGISTDESKDIEFFRHYLDFVKSQAQPVPDLIVHLRPTTPLRDPAVIDRALDYILTHEQATSLRSMNRTHLTPYKMFMAEGEFAKPFMTWSGEREFYNLPRQTFPVTFQPNGYVDIIRPRTLLKTGLLHGERIKIWETEKVADIDVTEDCRYAAELLKAPQFRSLTRFLEETHG